jgi:hypothetical protein
VHAYIFESFNLSYICNQVVTTTLLFSKSLDDCSNGFIMSSYINFAHVWVHAAPKDVALRVIASAEQAACVHGYWLPRHVWHMPLEGHVLIPDLACPVFEDVLLCDSGVDGIVHSASLCG